MLELLVNNKPVQLQPKCNVQIDKTKESFSSFVTVGYNEHTGKTTLLQNTDTVTLGQATKLILQAFKNSYNNLTDKEKALVDGALK